MTEVKRWTYEQIAGDHIRTDRPMRGPWIEASDHDRVMGNCEYKFVKLKFISDRMIEVLEKHEKTIASQAEQIKNLTELWLNDTKDQAAEIAELKDANLCPRHRHEDRIEIDWCVLCAWNESKKYYSEIAELKAQLHKAESAMRKLQHWDDLKEERTSRYPSINLYFAEVAAHEGEKK